jgi:hypothetical protein
MASGRVCWLAVMISKAARRFVHAIPFLIGWCRTSRSGFAGRTGMTWRSMMGLPPAARRPPPAARRQLRSGLEAVQAREAAEMAPPRFRQHGGSGGGIPF